MAYANETIPGGAAIELKKIRTLIQDFHQRDMKARELGVSNAALLTMLQTEETRVAALT